MVKLGISTGNDILVAIDNGPFSKAVFKFALELARRSGKDLFGLTVIDAEQLINDEDEQAKHLLANFRMKQRADEALAVGVAFRFSILVGCPAALVAKYGNLTNVAHVVLGKYGEHHMAGDTLGHEVVNILGTVNNNVTVVQEYLDLNTLKTPNEMG